MYEFYVRNRTDTFMSERESHVLTSKRAGMLLGTFVGNGPYAQMGAGVETIPA